MEADQIPDEIVEAGVAVVLQSYGHAAETCQPWLQREIRKDVSNTLAAAWPLIAQRVLVEAAADVYWQTTLDAATARVARAWLRDRAAALAPEGRGSEGV